ncbi:MAG: 30S ribosomal protein S2 [Candidatus Algichlamydia australiensis]|nr:30S ribosomal protein S2 [Chlamydiales bacterium]
MAKKQITVKDLLESGAHFGHQKRRWNPKMRPYIFGERNGICIIDLAKTMQQVRTAVEMVEDAVENHKKILFVGTKKQAKSVVKECAENAGEAYVSERWLGGMLTNLTTIRASVKKLEQIEKVIASGGEGLKKKEMVLLGKSQEKLDRNLCGIRAMRKPPGLIIVVDPSKEHIAVAEANKLGIPVLALVDTNCDPDPIDHVIPCNDDALKSIKLILGALTDAIIEKKAAKSIEIKKTAEATIESQVEEIVEDAEEGEKE